MPLKGARDVTITLRLDEDERSPWTVEDIEKWLRQELDFKEEVIDILDIHFPNGMYGDLTDEDIDC